MVANREGVFVLFLKISLVFGGNDISISKPRNAAVIAGERMEMECRSDSESKVIFWYFVSIGSNKTPVTLVTNIGSKQQLNENFSPRFGVDFDENGSGIIYFNTTTVENAGIYICEVEKDSNIIKYSAQMIVFESEPICETNLKEEYISSFDEFVWMRCRVGFRGSWTPEIQWSRYIAGNGTEEVVDGVYTLIHNNTFFDSTLNVSTSSIVYNSSYAFKTFFAQSNRSFKTNATNIPYFSFTWNSSSIGLTIRETTSSKKETTAAIKISTSTKSTGNDNVSLIVGLMGLIMAFVAIAVVVTAAVWRYKFLKRRSGTEAESMPVAHFYENLDDSELARNRPIDPVRTTPTHQRSPQYEVLDGQSEPQVYNSLIPEYCNLTLEKSDSTDATEDGDKRESPKFTPDAYEEIAIESSS